MENKKVLQYEAMTTSRLERILQRSLFDNKISIDDILVITDILNRREPSREQSPQEAEAAWNRFVANKLKPASDSPSDTGKVIPINWRRRIYRQCAIVAISTVLTIGVVFSAQAFNIDIIGSIVRWTVDTFYFESEDNPTDRFEGAYLSDIDLSDGEMPEDFIPSWMPEGFQLTTSTLLPGTTFRSILHEYRGNNNSFLNILLTKYESSDFVFSDTFERQPSIVEELTFYGKTFAISKNGDSDLWTAAWSDGSLVLQITGNVSRDNLIKIINSFGGVS